MPDDPKDDAQEGLKKLLEKHSNDAMALAGQLHTENFQLREQKRALKAQLDAAEKLKPADGSVVLSKAEAERYDAYKALGKPEELGAIRTERDELKTKVAKAERDSSLRTVAEVEGFDAEVFTSLVTNDQSFEIKEIKKDNQTIKQAFIVIESDGKKESKPLAEFAAEKWSKFLPALKPEPEVKGTPIIKQTKGEPPREADAVAQQKAKLASSGKYQI